MTSTSHSDDEKELEFMSLMSSRVLSAPIDHNVPGQRQFDDISLKAFIIEVQERKKK